LPRTSVAAKRKLFLVHAGELAHRLAQAVGRGGLVAHFVHSYAQRHNRPGLLGGPERMRELESTIGRETLLVMAADVRHRVARVFSSGSRGASGSEEAAFSEAFFAEFLAALCRALVSSPEEARTETVAFRRDLAMYQRWSHRPGAGEQSRRANALRSPFPDRCALLLDPSMMETARRAAADFETEIVHVEARVFAQLGRHSIPRRKKTNGPRHPGKQRRPARKAPGRSKSSFRRSPKKGKKPRRSRKQSPRRPGRG
jgi:hypothetical protein